MTVWFRWMRLAALTLVVAASGLYHGASGLPASAAEAVQLEDAGNGIAGSAATFQAASDAAAVQEVVYLWQDDYEAHAVGGAPAGYTVNAPAGTSITVTDNVYAGGSRSLQLSDETNTARAMATARFEAAADVVWEMDIKTDDWVELALLNGSTVGPHLYFRPNGTLFYLNPDRAFVQIHPGYVANEWQRVRLVTDSVYGTYDLYLNDLPLHLDTPMENALSAFDGIRLMTGTSSRGYTAYVDRMDVYRYEETEEPMVKLVAPLPDRPGIPTSPLFVWEALDDAVDYRLQLSEQADLSAPLYNEMVGPVTSKRIEGLMAATRYYWSVTAYGSDGEVYLSELASFVTEDRRVYVWQDDFEAYAVGGAPAGYTVNAPAGTSITVADGVYASGSRSLQLSDETNTARATATARFEAAADVVWELDIKTDDWVELALLNGSTVGPHLYFRPNGTLFYLNPERAFVQIQPGYTANEWQRVRLVTDSVYGTYDLYLNDLALHLDTPMENVLSAFDGIRLMTGTSSRGYTAYVDRMDVYRYPLEGSPGPFQLLAPADGAEQVAAAAAFTWEASSLADSYRLIVARDAAFANVVFDEDVGASTSHMVSGLYKNSRYYWKVIAINDIATAESDRVHTFTTETTAQPLAVSFTSVADYDGGALTGWDGQRFVRTAVSVANETDAGLNGAVTIALYDGTGELLDFATVKKRLEGRTTDTFRAGFSLPKAGAQAEGYVLKGFVAADGAPELLLSNVPQFPGTSSTGSHAAQWMTASGQVASSASMAVDAAYDPNAATMHISGSMTDGAGHPVTVQVVGPDLGVSFIGQTIADETGAFSASYAMSDPVEGVYRVYAGGSGMQRPVLVTVEAEGSSEPEPEPEPPASIGMMAQIIASGEQDGDIEAVFAAQLQYRLSVIQLLSDQGALAVASAYLQDFLRYIHDPSVQGQQLIDTSVAERLAGLADALIQAWS